MSITRVLAHLQSTKRNKSNNNLIHKYVVRVFFNESAATGKSYRNEYKQSQKIMKKHHLRVALLAS